MTVTAPGRSNCVSVARGGGGREMTLRPTRSATSADGPVDPEDGLPAGPGGEAPAEQDTGGDPQASDGSPQRQALPALVPA